jgi:hypothetical protein
MRGMHEAHRHGMPGMYVDHSRVYATVSSSRGGMSLLAANMKQVLFLRPNI